MPLQFQIASQASTAISTFRTTPPPAVLAPGPLQFQGVAGATVPPRPRLSGYVLSAEMPCSGPGCPGTRSASSTDFSDHRPGFSLSQLPPKTCKPPAVLRSFASGSGSGGLAGRACDPVNSCGFTGSPAAPPPPPHPLQFHAHCLPCDSTTSVGFLGGGCMECAFFLREGRPNSLETRANLDAGLPGFPILLHAVTCSRIATNRADGAALFLNQCPCY
jgi:hypothetical protein